MSQSQNVGGSVRRAREMAEAGLLERTGRPQAPPGMQNEDGQLAISISRPTPMPQSQWPLPSSIQSPMGPDSTPYRPPPGSSPPQRPPRPSVVPSILDGSKIQEHTPVFQYTTNDARYSEMSMTDTLGSPNASSRPMTVSSVGSIPDFPLPSSGQLQPPPAPPAPRRSVNLGPPPSARRGASSFYSTASFVSPIPEESPRRSHASIASSAAMPTNFGDISPSLRSADGHFYDDTIIEESIYGDGIEEKGLVRSASIGKRGKPSIVTHKTSDKADHVPRPGTNPLQRSALSDGTGFLDGSSTSSGNGSSSEKIPVVLTTNLALGAYEAASASDPHAALSPKGGRLSALRRPPRLDIDAVREAEARGSLTSLPDLIKRATRLASLMDKGRRPASRFDDLMFTSEDVYARRDRDFRNSEKYQSGLSDMLAAFPPPAANSRQSTRQSGAWPLAAPTGDAIYDEKQEAEESNAAKQKRRCCCGMPKWLVIFIIIVLLCIIAAAVAVPLKLVVFKDTAPTPAAALEMCQNQVTCQNGGTNVIANGVCACICSNGFTGPTCTTASSQGCTTTTINTASGTSGKVTLGSALPRLFEQAQPNFSIPLSAPETLAKFSASDMTCAAQNALVTFGGQALQVNNGVQEAMVGGAIPTLTTVLPDLGITLTLTASQVFITTLTQPTMLTGSVTTILTTIVSMSNGNSLAKPTNTASTAPTTPTTTPAPTAGFTVSDNVLNFARVAVLYVLQEKSMNQATDAQSALQRFFTKATSSAGVTVEEARKVDLGSSIKVDFVGLFIDVGAGNVGGGPLATSRRRGRF